VCTKKLSCGADSLLILKDREPHTTEQTNKPHLLLKACHCQVLVCFAEITGGKCVGFSEMLIPMTLAVMMLLVCLIGVQGREIIFSSSLCAISTSW
jgi:hypothetical protein